MKSAVRVLLIYMTCLIVVPATLAKKPVTQRTAGPSGIYDNFTVGKGSGDLEGMRVVLVAAGDGHYAIVQIAQGGAEDPKPEWVPVKVKGNTVNFTVGNENFSGTVSAAGLRIESSSRESQLLKLKPCSSYFKQ